MGCVYQRSRLLGNGPAAAVSALHFARRFDSRAAFGSARPASGAFGLALQRLGHPPRGVPGSIIERTAALDRDTDRLADRT
jgi:hypothetical protein